MMSRPLETSYMRMALLIYVLYCFPGFSSGFQVVPAFKKQRNRQISFDLTEVNSVRSLLVAPSHASSGNNNGVCMSGVALRNRKEGSDNSLCLYPQSADNDVFKSQSRSQLFEHYHSEFRLLFVQFASKTNNDDTSPSSGKLRSFISKVFKRLTSPVKRVARWIRNKFKKTDKFLEETIEEQESAVEKAIRDMEARANEMQAKTAALTSEQSMLDKIRVKAEIDAKLADTDTDEATDISEPLISDESTIKIVVNGAPKVSEPTEPKVDTTVKPEEGSSDGSVPALEKVPDAPAQTTSAEMPTEVETKLGTVIPPMTAQEDLLAQEREATAEAQIDIVEKVEAAQTKDAAMATEEQMFAELDKPGASDSDVMSGMTAARKQTAQPSSTGMPVGDRWAIASPGVNLSGEWKLIVTDEFKNHYDEYLKQLGQPFIVRSVALTLIGLTAEHTEQKEEGRTLFIRGTNARGVWERTLVTSGADMLNDKFTELHVPVDTADDERVEAEAWWEDNGTVHRSWMRGLKKYGGGSFESKRYLEDDGKVLVCESTFHPDEQDRKKVGITWRFLREGGALAS